MPYQLEKGPYWSVVEAALQKDAATAYWMLLYLRDPNKPIAGGPIVTSTNLNTGQLDTTAKRADHLNKDWFGMYKDATGKWVKTPDSEFDPVTRPSLGFWINYWGDVESIVRETFVRAIEQSLGLAHDEVLARGASPRRHWPVSIFLKCPTPWFEGWVSWRKTGRTAGSVEVHFLIPGVYGSQVLLDPKGGKFAPPQPIDPTANNGMWLVSHEKHTRVLAMVTSDPGSAGQWTFPVLGHLIKDAGEIITVCPSEPDGGVAPGGRAYQPEVTP
jgi:hypothetical protein